MSLILQEEQLGSLHVDLSSSLMGNVGKEKTQDVLISPLLYMKGHS